MIFLGILCVYILPVIKSASISTPLVHDHEIKDVLPRYSEQKETKRQFFNATPVILEKHPQDLSHADYPSCNIPMKAKFITNVGSSVYAPPTIHPVGQYNDKKSILLSTFYEYIELINSDGSKPLGWPLSLEGSSFQGSPLLYDIDGDGNNDLCIVDKNANIFWIRIGEVGQYLEDFHAQVPKLKVKKEWYKGLDTTFVDRYAQFSMFDRHASRDFDPDGSSGDTISEEVKGKPSNKVKLDALSAMDVVDHDAKYDAKNDKHDAVDDTTNNNNRRKLHYVMDKERLGNDHFGRRLQEVVSIDATAQNESSSSEKIITDHNQDHDIDIDIEEDPEAIAYAAGMDIINHPELQDAFLGGNRDIFGDGGGEGLPDLSSGYNNKFDDYREAMHDAHGGYRSFDDGMHYSYGGGITNDDDMIYIDPHVLSTPSLIDIDNDGHMELVIAISYYFDAADYPDPEHDTVDRSMYVAGGIACWDIENEEWVWLVHLDLTTDKTAYKAYIHSSPTIVDLDGDGRYEVLIGTSLGLLYLLDGDTGFVRRHFPMQFHAIEAQIVVADILGNNILEIIIADMAGNLVAINPTGDVLWEIQLAGALPYTPTIGDVDGDGQLDIVVIAVTDILDATDDIHNHDKLNDKHHNNTNKHHPKINSHSYIYAIHGVTGKILEGYPVALPNHDRATGPAILVDLHDHDQESSSIINKDHQKSNKASLLKYSDPYLPPWMINDETIWAHSNDHNNRPVLSPSLDTSSSSYNKTSYDGRNSIIKANRGLHMMIPAFNGHIYILSKSSAMMTKFGSASPIQCSQRLDIGDHIASTPLITDVDNNGYLDIIIGTLNGQIYSYETKIPYHPINAWNSFPKYRHSSTVTHGSVGISIPMNIRNNLRYSDIQASSNHQVMITFDIWDNRPMGNDNHKKYHVMISKGTNKRTSLAQGEYDHPGRYSLHVDVSPPEAMNLIVSMTTEHSMYYEDMVWVSISTRFYVWMKYLPTIPAILLCIPLLLMRRSKKTSVY